MWKKNRINQCKLLSLPKISNRSGNITFVENNSHIPFNVKRVFYLYDIPGGEKRGGHAHYELEQYIIAASGSFVVILDDGKNTKTVTLNRPNIALHIVPGLWRQLDDFSSGSISLVLASHIYEEGDYIRDYNEFLNFKK